MENTAKLSPYRWVIGLLLFLALFSQAVTWLAPAAILAPIIRSLAIGLGPAGLIISIIALCISVFSLLGAVIAQRVGSLRALLCGLWLMAIGQILSGYTTTLGALLACRLAEGVGSGVMIAPPATMVMEWFGEHERPYVNMINSLCSCVGFLAAFAITAPMFLALGASWQRVFFWYGIGTAGVALAWSIFGRERRFAGEFPVAARSGSVLGELIRRREVRLTAATVFGAMWVFQLYTAFLPQYFHEVRGMSLTRASALTAILPLTGIFASIGGGVGTAIARLRKPFTWPIACCPLVGCAGVILSSDPAVLQVSLALIGAGMAAPLPAVVTLFMELPWMTPDKIAGCFALVWSAAYAAAFLAPFVGGVLASKIGLRAVMLGFIAFEFLPIVAMYFLPETGPGRGRFEVGVCPAD
jgi:predicted MFS family arabinose efflux permease